MSANLDNGVILGALGSVYTNTDTAITPPPGMVIAAIQFLSSGSTAGKIKALVAEDPNKTFNTVIPSHQDNDGSAVAGYNSQDHGDGGQTLGSETVVFSHGLTLYGRWTSATFAADSNGGVICYFGY